MGNSKNMKRSEVNLFFKKANEIEGKNSSIWREDEQGNIINRSAYEDEKSKFGWRIYNGNNENEIDVENSIPLSYLSQIENANLKKSNEDLQKIFRILNENKRINCSLPVAAVAFKNIDDDLKDMFIESNDSSGLDRKNINKGHAEQLVYKKMHASGIENFYDYSLAITTPPCDACLNVIKGKFKNIYYVVDKEYALKDNRDIMYRKEKNIEKLEPETYLASLDHIEMESSLEYANVSNKLMSKINILRRKYKKENPEN